jgi:hypothetical protein
MRRLLFLFSLTGCASAQMTPAEVDDVVRNMSARVVTIDVPFDSLQAHQLLQPGRNTIRGSAMLRQQGGGVVTCAGTEVRLVPVTAYASERMMAFYGSTDRAPAISRIQKIIVESPHADAEAWNRLQRMTLCNPQGFFAFDRVADGQFFILASVDWVVAGENQGRALMQRVAVKGGETVEPVVTWP